jgi:hypothetical protein
VSRQIRGICNPVATMQPLKFVMCVSSKTLLDSAAEEVLLNPNVVSCTQMKCASIHTIPPCVCLGNAFSELSSFKSLHEHALSTSLNIHCLLLPWASDYEFSSTSCGLPTPWHASLLFQISDARHCKECCSSRRNMNNTSRTYTSPHTITHS